jgi:hypothetical protein
MAPEPESGSRPRKIRWRSIPVAIAAGVGSTFFFFGVFSLFTNLSPDWIEVLDNVWVAFLGGCLIASSILWWKGRWLIGTALIAACLLCPLILFGLATS